MVETKSSYRGDPGISEMPVLWLEQACAYKTSCVLCDMVAAETLWSSEDHEWVPDT